MMTSQEWIQLLLISKENPSAIWQQIAGHLHILAKTCSNYALLHQATVFPDRLLSEAAYELWESFASDAPHTSQRLAKMPHSHAILILDALSLRELPIILHEAEKRGLATKSEVTFSEAPSDTNTFAQALGAPSRASLRDNGKPASFTPFAEDGCYTDCQGIPFADVPIPNEPNIVIWHSYLDDQIHNGRSGKELEEICKKEFSSDSFWILVDKMRQGRKLVITSDHGYGVSEQFSSELKDEPARIMKEHFKAQRSTEADISGVKFLPPLFIKHGDQHIVTGQRTWKVSGRSKVTHGGLSLLEVASPWIEIGAK